MAESCRDNCVVYQLFEAHHRQTKILTDQATTKYLEILDRLEELEDVPDLPDEFISVANEARGGGSRIGQLGVMSEQASDGARQVLQGARDVCVGAKITKSPEATVGIQIDCGGFTLDSIQEITRSFRIHEDYFSESD